MQSLVDSSAGIEVRKIVLGNLQINVAAYEASIGGERIGLTLQEFELLSLLARNADRLVLQDGLARALWKESSRRHRRRLSVVVARLRQKLHTADPYHIETVRKRGYRLACRVPPMNGSES